MAEPLKTAPQQAPKPEPGSVAATRNQITQHELHQLARYGMKIRDLKRELAKLEADREELAESVIDMLDAGLPQQGGKFAARTVQKAGRKSVSWKSVVVDELGKPFADRVMAAAKPGPGKRVLEVVPVGV